MKRACSTPGAFCEHRSARRGRRQWATIGTAGRTFGSIRVNRTVSADDCAVKPFSPRELVARVQAVLRRSGPGRTDSEAVFVHRDLFLNTKKHQLRIGKRPVALTPSEFALLETLMADPGRAFTREELLRCLYWRMASSPRASWRFADP